MSMTLDETIKVLNEWYPDCAPALHPKFPEAVKLGAEAMKRIRHDREAMQAKHILLLPVETEG